MKYLFLLALLLIGYGSLYPFDFVAHGAPLRVLLEPGSSPRGDILENLALFLPYGYLGMVAWSRPRGPLRFLLVVGTGAAYAVALQWAQLYLPSRDATLRDVVPNVLGTVIGAAAGSVPALDVRRIVAGGRMRAVPLLLIAVWLGYRLLPFVPALDWQEWKDSLKPLRDWHPFPWIGAFHDAAAWAAVGCLWAGARLRRLGPRWLPLLVVATLCAEVVIVDNGVSPANVAGAAAGVLLAAVFASRPGIVGVLLAAAVVLEGLAPFQVRPAPQAFVWIPFGGFLDGSMLVNAQSLFEKTFLYGTLVWLAREAGLRLRFASCGTALLLAAIEVAQTRLGNHTPEITDPLLALFAGVFLALAEPPRPPPNPVESPSLPKEGL
jgi:VanZ family protein